MTDKQKLQYILDHTQLNNIESIMDIFLLSYFDDLSLDTINSLREKVQKTFDNKLTDLLRLQRVAKERATWIKSYLEGRMWPDEESAKKNLQPQIDNCQVIIDACNPKGEW